LPHQQDLAQPTNPPRQAASLLLSFRPPCLLAGASGRVDLRVRRGTALKSRWVIVAMGDELLSPSWLATNQSCLVPTRLSSHLTLVADWKAREGEQRHRRRRRERHRGVALAPRPWKPACSCTRLKILRGAVVRRGCESAAPGSIFLGLPYRAVLVRVIERISL
jgi:hypothetical protein